MLYEVGKLALNRKNQTKTENNTASNTSEELKQRLDKKTGFYYSFLTLVLLFCLIQVGFGVILNVSKTISYRAKIFTMQKIKNAAITRNDDLKQEIKMFSSATSLEGIARNNLKMASEDEVLILINNPPVEKTNKKKNILDKFKKIVGKNNAK